MRTRWPVLFLAHLFTGPVHMNRETRLVSVSKLQRRARASCLGRGGEGRWRRERYRSRYSVEIDFKHNLVLPLHPRPDLPSTCIDYRAG
ncbi:hypothetical protein LZ32DRAFT_115462 [Colletotrichum eremochloae]|nr:hypothetical protein LZ32DRAFT_115462 [Colletotrichum eremochloae]